MSTISQLLELEEGYRERAYYCSEGYPTIGIGKKIGGKGVALSCYDFTVSKELARQWVDEEVACVVKYLNSTYPWFERLNQPRKDVIVSMCYQIGTSGFSKFKKFIAYMGHSEFENASIEMLDSRWAKQTRARAYRHSAVIAGGAYNCVKHYKSIES